MAERSAEQRNDLTRFASRFWAGEAEVAHAFFSVPRSKEEHLRWLRLQAYKELQPRSDGLILKLVDKLKADYPKLEYQEGRDDYLYTIQFLMEEFRHYVLFADVIDDLTGERITPDELATYELPGETALRKVRRDYIEEHGNLASFASSFCEGGGASIYYEGSLVGGDLLSDKIAAACKSVYDDEVDHAAHGATSLSVQAKTEEDWALARDMVEVISKARVLMRNEQFGSLLSEDRLAEIFAGNIELPARYAELLI
jgi:hypothetical protein